MTALIKILNLIYSTTGGMGVRARAFHQRLASLVVERRQETYGEVLNVMRTKLSFAMLKSVLVSVRGARGKKVTTPVTPISCTSFNMVPEGLGNQSMFPSRLGDM